MANGDRVIVGCTHGEEDPDRVVCAYLTVGGWSSAARSRSFADVGGADGDTAESLFGLVGP
jgi:hypothetical protein